MPTTAATTPSAPLSAPPANAVLGAFLAEWRGRALPPEVTHEARRALLNSLGASVGAAAHPTVAILRDGALRSAPSGSPSHILWLGDAVVADQAALVNAALMHVLDFDDTHLATYCHPAPPVFSALLAEGERVDASGTALLQAAALGMEVELLVARALFPSHYLRGNHISATTGAVGAAAACAVLHGLDAEQSAHALGLAMATAAGSVETIGTMGNAYGVGNAARGGVAAAWLAGRGLTTARTALDGEKGMLRASSDEHAAGKLDGLLAALGSDWQVLRNSYKRFATETITQAPLECVFDMLAEIDPVRRGALTSVRLTTAPIVVDVVRQRSAKIGGGPPRDELEATFDIRYCVAAAWLAGTWSHDQLLPEAIESPTVRALRERIEVVGDPSVGVEDATLLFRFADGSEVERSVRGFRGSEHHPMSDGELRAKLVTAADGALDDGAAARIADATLAFGGDGDSCRDLMRLLRLPGR
jgi:2-methylcitrate dehydratase PrpD